MTRDIKQNKEQDVFIAAIIDDVNRIRDGLSDYLGRLRVELKSRNEPWRVEVLPQLSGAIDVRTHRLQLLQDDKLIFDVHNFYSNLADQEEEASEFELIEFEKLSLPLIHIHHFLVTIAQGKGITLVHRLKGGKSAPDPRNEIEAETLRLTARWDEQAQYTDVDHRYPIICDAQPAL